ncbi:MAG: beta-ribofuranosylaminobenzene 5'-phosphate synthase family protein [Gammaproteobacteria bacterium]
MSPDPQPIVKESERLVTVAAPARLHLGFIDLCGDLGRRYGGFGLAITGIATRLSMQPALSAAARGPGGERALDYARRLLRHLGLRRQVAIEVHEAIPAHVGLGSGTQMALAVCAALRLMFDIDADVPTLARVTERGARSGIGVGAFQNGGFIVDGGRGVATQLPPVVCQMPFPDEWRVLLVFDPALAGLNGMAEARAFAELAPMSPEHCGRISRLLLMQVLPAVAEQDFERFCLAITAIQDLLGDYFAALQGGRYTSPAVAAALDGLRSHGVPGIGQSSWGPTGFAFLDSAQAAEQALNELRTEANARLRYAVCAARNRGADVLVQRRAA